MTRLKDAIRREKAREAADTQLSETSELLVDLTDKLKRREAQLAALLDVAEAAKALLLLLDHVVDLNAPTTWKQLGPAAVRLRDALAATAEVLETRLPPADSGQVNVFDPRRP